MGVSVDTGGGGRGKSQNFDLNLVPFIDLLSVCITFLIATAVWAQVMSLQVDQAISEPNPDDPPPPTDDPPHLPLTINIRADGMSAWREIEKRVNYARIPNPAAETDERASEFTYEWEKLRADLVAVDRVEYPDPDLASSAKKAEDADGDGKPDPAHPEDDQVVIFTEDGVTYEHMIAALDLTRDLGYDKTLLAGGKVEATALPTAPK